MEVDLKKLRKILGLTQEKLADELGVSLATIVRWETGKTKPSPLARQRINQLVKEAVK